MTENFEMFPDRRLANSESAGMQEFSIYSYGADYDVAGLVRRLDNGDIKIPEFQRKFVWTKERASRFIESLLVGLPVPGIFLYREKDSEILEVIDGQQRLRTLQSFLNGKAAFGSNEEMVFDLQGEGIEQRFVGLAFVELGEKYRRKLENSIIHATIIRQDKPDNEGSSKYFVFERLNTEASQLSDQEIRAAVYQGKFNSLIQELNRSHSWRELYGGSPEPDPRKRDEELILRFFALYFTGVEKYSSPMKAFLNLFMLHNRNLDAFDVQEMRIIFGKTADSILSNIGEDAFRPRGRRNAAVTEAVMVGVARAPNRTDTRPTMRACYDQLVANPDFYNSVSRGTSQTQNVRTRIRLAIDAFASDR